MSLALFCLFVLSIPYIFLLPFLLHNSGIPFPKEQTGRQGGIISWWFRTWSLEAECLDSSPVQLFTGCVTWSG